MSGSLGKNGKAADKQGKRRDERKTMHEVPRDMPSLRGHAR
jgi:hypothetical protein